MAILLSTFLAQVDGMIDADNDILDDLERYRQVKAAVAQYSRDKPDEDVDDVTGDGGRYYALATELTNWYEGFSRVLGIEYPAATVASDEAPVYLSPDDWDDDYWASSTRYLYLPNHEPASTETMRIRYTAPWFWASSSTTTSVSQTGHGFSVDDYVYQDSDGNWQDAVSIQTATHQVSAVTDADNCTVKILQTGTPTEDFYAICCLAAAYCCRALAVKFSKSKESTIAIDSAHHTTKAMEHASRAEELEQCYRQAMGLEGDGYREDGGRRDAPAGSFIDWDITPRPGRQFVWHSEETR